MTTGLANLAGRSVWIDAGSALDVERASDGRFSSDPMAPYEDWAAFRAWAADASGGGEAFDPSALGPCVPRPKQVFAVGLNYRDHAEESGLDIPNQPMIFTKFPSCLVGPQDDVLVSSPTVDWEAELVIVIGRETDRVDASSALDHVAGFCVGQDISDRRLQMASKPPQFSMGKSCRTFGPIGPAVVPLDLLSSPEDLAITCDVSGERMQESRTKNLIFSVRDLVAYLSSHCTLYAGDVVFSGTPSGVGAARKPPRFLAEGDVIRSEIEGLGVLENRCVAG